MLTFDIMIFFRNDNSEEFDYIWRKLINGELKSQAIICDNGQTESMWKL